MAKLYGALPIDDVALAREVAPFVTALDGRLLAAEELRALTAERGIDFATMAHYQAILAAPQHRSFVSWIDGQPLEQERCPMSVKLYVVPAYFYREHPEVGGGGEHVVQVARACGIDAAIVPIKSVGSVLENARIIRDILQRSAASHIWLMSLSKGSAEVRLLLQDYADVIPTDAIKVWLNVCGLVNGCDLVDHMLGTSMRRVKTRALCVAVRADYRGLEELHTAHAYWKNPLSLPRHMQVVNIFGLPLLSHVQRRLVTRYQRLKHLGPNDGMVVLPKAVLPGGPIYPLWGVDHFMRDTRVIPLLYRLFGALRKGGKLQEAASY